MIAMPSSCTVSSTPSAPFAAVRSLASMTPSPSTSLAMPAKTVTSEAPIKSTVALKLVVEPTVRTAMLSRFSIAIRPLTKTKLAIAISASAEMRRKPSSKSITIPAMVSVW